MNRVLCCLIDFCAINIQAARKHFGRRLFVNEIAAVSLSFNYNDSPQRYVVYGTYLYTRKQTAPTWVRTQINEYDVNVRTVRFKTIPRNAQVKGV